MQSRTMPIRPAPSICPSCPWRTAVTPTPEQIAVVQEAVRTGEPQPCTSSGEKYASASCLPWLVTCGADNPRVVDEVASGRLKIGQMVRPTNGPSLHDGPGAVIAAVYRAPEKVRVDPVMIALRETREAAGLSQPDVARRLGVHEQTVRDHEAGRRVPSLTQVRAYADAYGMDLAVIARRR